MFYSKSGHFHIFIGLSRSPLFLISGSGRKPQRKELVLTRRKIIEKNFELNLWANLHFFILDYSLTLCSSSCHMNSTRSLEIKYYNLYCKTSV